jgi:uncharacterized protein YcbK (DUF882 family)
MLRLGIALLVGVAVQGQAGAREGDPFDGADEAEAPAPAAEASAEAPAPRQASKKGRTRVKVKRSRTGAKVVGHVVPDDKLRATPPPKPSGNLHLFVLATQEEIKVNIYNPDGSYNVEALQQVSHLLRCKRTDTERDIEPRLMTALSHVYDHFDGKRLEVVSGFRNQRRTTSFHYQASASDIRVPGVKPAKLRAFVETLDAGGMGIGLYPRTQFVHIDVRPPPSYRWIDWSRSDPDNPDKRPPRGLRRRKLQS